VNKKTGIKTSCEIDTPASGGDWIKYAAGAPDADGVKQATLEVLRNFIPHVQRPTYKIIANKYNIGILHTVPYHFDVCSVEWKWQYEKGWVADAAKSTRVARREEPSHITRFRVSLPSASTETKLDVDEA
jgi:hypothetical protein